MYCTREFSYRMFYIHQNKFVSKRYKKNETTTPTIR